MKRKKKDQIIIFYSNDQRVKMSICHKGGAKMTQMVYEDLVNSKGIEWDKGCEFLSRIRWYTFAAAAAAAKSLHWSGLPFPSPMHESEK